MDEKSSKSSLQRSGDKTSLLLKLAYFTLFIFVILSLLASYASSNELSQAYSTVIKQAESTIESQTCRDDPSNEFCLQAHALLLNPKNYTDVKGPKGDPGESVTIQDFTCNENTLTLILSNGSIAHTNATCSKETP